MQDDQKQAERDLDKIFNLATDIICVADLQGQLFKRVNPAFTRILGYDREEVQGRPILEFIHPEDRGKTLAKIQEELKTGASTLNFTNRYLHKNGGSVWLEWVTRPVPEEGTAYAIGRDITERKRMEQELLKLQKLESIGILAGGIAHDFNNLLTAIMGSISFSRMLVPPDDKVARLLFDAEQACTAAKELSYRLLTFSRGGDPIRRPVSLEAVIRESVRMALDDASVDVSVAVPDDLPSVDADEGQMRQVINSLLLNALEAMPSGGGISINAGVAAVGDREIASLAPGKYIRIAIEDTGTGIPEDILPNIFDPYFSTKGMGSRKGRGLGLAICHSIIRKHEGTVTAESRTGKGSRFSVYLPISVQPVASDPEAPAPSPETAKGRILVMDDDARVSAIAREMLQFMQFDTVEASNGDEAIDHYVRARRAGMPFTLVILDLTVPKGLGGVDTFRKLRQIDPAVLAVVSTGYAEDPIVREYKDHGFAGAIAKPYNLKQLQDTLSGILERTGE